MALQSAMTVLPILRSFDILRVSINLDELTKSSVPFVRPSIPAVEALQYTAAVTFCTFGTGFLLLDAEAAHLDLASRSRYVPLSVFIANLASFAAAQDERPTGLTICPAATDEPDFV